MDAPTIFTTSPYSPQLLHHISESCTTCVARYQRHQRRNHSYSSEETSTDSLSETTDANIGAQLSATESARAPPPPYSRRRRYERLDVDPPTYSDVLITPPPGVAFTIIPITLRYTETLILEDDGYSKVVYPTARKYKTEIKIYASMDWDRFTECLKQVKPTVMMRDDGLKDVRALRHKGRWERMICTRLAGVRLCEDSWKESRAAICNGDMDKVVIAV